MSETNTENILKEDKISKESLELMNEIDEIICKKNVDYLSEISALYLLLFKYLAVSEGTYPTKHKRFLGVMKNAEELYKNFYKLSEGVSEILNKNFINEEQD